MICRETATQATTGWGKQGMDVAEPILATLTCKLTIPQAAQVLAIVPKQMAWRAEALWALRRATCLLGGVILDPSFS